MCWDAVEFIITEHSHLIAERIPTSFLPMERDPALEWRGDDPVALCNTQIVKLCAFHNLVNGFLS